MSWLHAAYAAGATAGPSLMTAVLARGGSWRAGYAAVGAVLALLALGFTAARRRWEPDGALAPRVLDAPGGVGPLPLPHAAPESAPGALRSGRVWLQMALFLLYVGLEVAAGQWSYTLLTELRGLGAAAAGTWVAVYWGGLLAGRVLLGFVVERVGQVRLLRLATLGALLFASLFALHARPWTLAALPLLSFSLAAIYPGLMAETPRRVGEGRAAHAVGFQVSAATLGFALLPGAAGLVGERLGLEAIGPLLAGFALVLLLLHEGLVALERRPRPQGVGDSRQ
jgi:predicted MFS family arabinose efflux permease